MAEGPWQLAAAEELRARLEPDEAVRGLVLIGSCATAELDEWSDLDVLLVVADGGVACFHPGMEWLHCLGEPYAIGISEEQAVRAARVYFMDGRRVDVVVIAESALPSALRQSPGLLAGGVRCIFSRSAVVDRALAAIPPRSRPTPRREQFDRLGRDFWFKGMLAASKVARNDLLVALHLSLDMVRDCCVLGMMLRDRAAGTDHHREGSAGRRFVAGLQAAQQPYTARGILDAIQASAVLFDRLAGEYAHGYREQRRPLLDFVARVRESLPESRST